MNSDSMDREGLLSLARCPRATNSEGFEKIKNKIVELVRSISKNAWLIMLLKMVIYYNIYITDDISREILILSCLFMSPSSRSYNN